MHTEHSVILKIDSVAASPFRCVSTVLRLLRLERSSHSAGATRMEQKQRITRKIRIGRVEVGGDAPVVVQSMCATRTMDIDATIAQTHQLAAAGAGIVRIALDNEKEVAALREIRAQTRGIVLSVDLQENYKIADKVGPHV